MVRGEVFLTMVRDEGFLTKIRTNAPLTPAFQHQLEAIDSTGRKERYMERDGEMALWLRACTALPEGKSLVPSTHIRFMTTCL